MKILIFFRSSAVLSLNVVFGGKHWLGGIQLVYYWLPYWYTGSFSIGTTGIAECSQRILGENTGRERWLRILSVNADRDCWPSVLR